MALHIFELLRAALVDYGYWAVAAALLLENAGIPVPGETVLLLAGFLAYSEHTLHLEWIILIGTVAATIGDNLGYALGHRGGRPLLERYKRIFRINDAMLVRGDSLFAKYGPVTVFFARFVFGMRIIAGPMAGVLRMPWRKFFLYNFLGAAVWVTTVAFAGYLFGRHWDKLLRIMGRFNFVVAIAAVLVIAFLWWRNRQKR
jgi:membrane-associated protein